LHYKLASERTPKKFGETFATVETVARDDSVAVARHIYRSVDVAKQFTIITDI